MDAYKYLIVGGGMAADAAVTGIRGIDPDGSIGLFSAETDPPYDRPPLSKALWKGKTLDSIWRGTERKNATLHLGRRIISLNAEDHTVRDDQGNEFHGERILMATGGTPRRLPSGGEGILYYRTLQDYRRLEAMTKTGQDFAVIGGGFIGAEIAAALALNGKNVTMLFPEDAIGARFCPQDLSRFLSDFYTKKGIRVLAREQVIGTSSRGGRHELRTLSGETLTVEGIVAGIGIEPNTELGRAAGLKVGNGIVVDESLLTSHPGIYSAGDVAEFFNPALGKRLRVEHEDNANSMGRLAGRNMAGASDRYHYLPYFYSDLFELGYEAVGELDSRLTTAADWAEPYRKGIVYYFREGRVCGVLLWNVWNEVSIARELIVQPGPFSAQELIAKKAPSWRIPY
jgi:3-phenylpropionate/trans-cinnamate dioxygenase ferredoxin reductase subunit